MLTLTLWIHFCALSLKNKLKRQRVRAGTPTRSPNRVFVFLVSRLSDSLIHHTHSVIILSRSSHSLGHHTLLVIILSHSSHLLDHYTLSVIRLSHSSLSRSPKLLVHTVNETLSTRWWRDSQRTLVTKLSAHVGDETLTAHWQRDSYDTWLSKPSRFSSLSKLLWSTTHLTFSHKKIDCCILTTIGIICGKKDKKST